MSTDGWHELDRLLATDPADVGCERALEMLHVYVDLVLDGLDVAAIARLDADELARTGTTGAAALRYPGIAAHLRACGPCTEDYRGLLLAASSR